MATTLAHLHTPLEQEGVESVSIKQVQDGGKKGEETLILGYTCRDVRDRAFLEAGPGGQVDVRLKGETPWAN